jgi:hypothetical protein
MEFHEIANIFPLMDGPEFAALVDDIKQNGLIEHIITYDNKIVDGRNRYRACVAAGVEPRFEAWRPNGVSLTKWVISKNLHRRHLTSGQRAVCALDSLPWLEREARERQVQTLKQFATDPNTQDIFDDTVPAILPERGESREQAAELFGTSARYVQDAKAIQKRRPDLIDKVRSGEMAISEAKRELVRDDVKKSLLLPTDKYRIIYADPPWKYSDTVGGCLCKFCSQGTMAQLPVGHFSAENSQHIRTWRGGCSCGLRITSTWKISIIL